MGLQIKTFKALGQPLFQSAMATASPQASFCRSTPGIKWASRQAPQGDLWTSLAGAEFTVSQTCLLTGLAPFTSSFSLSHSLTQVSPWLSHSHRALLRLPVRPFLAAHASSIPYSPALSVYCLPPFSFSLPFIAASVSEEMTVMCLVFLHVSWQKRTWLVQNRQ